MYETSIGRRRQRRGPRSFNSFLSTSLAPRVSSPTLAQYLDTTTDSDGGIDLVAYSNGANEEDVPEIRHWSEKSMTRSPLHISEMPSPYLQHSDINITQPFEEFDWCDRGFHVDFQAHEKLPLQQGRFLGPGVSGGVYETICKGIRLAWKTKYCSRGIRVEQLREMDILKRLTHHHVVRLMGTYTHGEFLGLLLAPVAVCDLKTFIDDIDLLRERIANGKSCNVDNTQMMRRLDELCPDTGGGMDLHEDAVSRLSSYFGCLTGVVAYLHENRIRHKDIKPSNILLSHNGVWLADFGISSDFSDMSSSQSEAVDRGTPRYFAPEVASFGKSGRSADIFSLGCLFLEMAALIAGVPMSELQKLRPEQNGSFHANLKHKASWFALFSTNNIQLQHLLCEIQSMMNEDARSRPLAFQVERHLSIIAQFGGNRSRPLHGPCCARERFIDQVEHMKKEIENLRLEVSQRDEYIDDILKPRRSSRSRPPPEVPRPPMGSNIPGGRQLTVVTRCV